ncbi:hypothetical protein [Alicyclobacillus sp. SO9]|uniref:hypothetical protein n=1 Tax=Alicyclobacillus sp. SO9 TaxID=2665646 RepID=UPI0018E8DD7F|nr:hypothetical protein [Alicyclobacillus sp. SO9]QQE79965.1 hypothetical protein GI364_05665 [Alicyclobacillus sp. SO9]
MAIGEFGRLRLKHEVCRYDWSMGIGEFGRREAHNDLGGVSFNSTFRDFVTLCTPPSSNIMEPISELRT